MQLGDIGEGSSALYCLTNRVGRWRGWWNFPNGTRVGMDTAAGIYFIREFSSLLLNRRSSAVGPTGVYRCFISDEEGVLRTLSIMIIGEFWNMLPGMQ